MALAYKWTINQLDAKIHDEGHDNVIYTIHYTYTGSEGKYSSSVIGTLGVEYDPNTPFIPWADDQDFENVVISWLEKGVDVVTLQKSIQAQVDLEKNPVDENLYFTFNNPSPPVENNKEE